MNAEDTGLDELERAPDPVAAMIAMGLIESGDAQRLDRAMSAIADLAESGILSPDGLTRIIVLVAQGVVAKCAPRIESRFVRD